MGIESKDFSQSPETNETEKKPIFDDPKRQARMEAMADRVDAQLEAEDKDEADREAARKAIEEMDRSLDEDLEKSGDNWKDDETVLIGKYGVDPEEMAASRWGRIKLGLRKAVNPGLRKAWNSYQDNLNYSEGKDTEKRLSNSGRRRPKTKPMAGSRTEKITGPNRFGL